MRKFDYFKGLLLTIFISLALLLPGAASADRSLFTDTKVVQCVVPVVVTADATGVTVDCRGARAIMFTVQAGIEGDTLSGSVYIEYIIQGSNDDSTWAAVSTGTVSTATNASGVFGTVDADAEIPANISVSLTQITYRYYRVVIDVTGTHTNGTPHAVIAILDDWDVLPITNP